MSRKLCLIVLAVIWALFFVLFNYSLGAPNGLFRAMFMDVGQGDAALIQEPGGYNILIDGGRYTGPTVIANLRRQGVDHIDAMIASHADADHIGGLINVLKLTDIPVHAVYYNGYPGTSDTWERFATAVAEEGLELIPMQFPQVYTFGDTTANVLNPLPGLDDPETNQASVVILFRDGQVDYLFTGDIDSTIEATIVARGTPIAAEILKVAHHGSDTSSSAEFLQAVLPAEAVISVGEDNTYGHPDAATLERLLAVGANIWRTDLMGDIYVSSDGYLYTVTTEEPSRFVFLPVVFQSSAALSTPTPTFTSSPTPTHTALPNTPTPTATATGTPTATATATAIPTNTPTSTFTATPVLNAVVILDIFYDGSGDFEPDEYVVIRNDGTAPVQLLNWTLRDIAEHVYTFPSFSMAPGQVCRVYTNEIHAEYCGFSYGSGSAIWTNSGDCAYLCDAANHLIDDFCY